MMTRPVGWLAVLVLLLTTGRAAAADDADALFLEGRDLLLRERYAEACEKLRRSEEIAPGVGTLINLGYCWEQLQKMRSAMEAYAEAETLARAQKDEKRASMAHDRFVAASALVIKLIVRVADPSIPGLEVTRNGTKVLATDYNHPIPIDPDDIVILAKAPNRTPWRAVVQGRGNAAAITVIVPQLEDATPKTAAEPELLGTRRIVALGLGGVGLFSIGAGVALALGAKARYDDAGDRCDASGCDPRGVELQSSATAQGNVATALVAVGVVFAGAGAYLWLSGGEKRRVALTPFGVQGSF